MKTNLLMLLLVVFSLSVRAQSQKETIIKSAGFSGPESNRVLSVENIHGSVKVEAYNGDKVLLTAEKSIKAKNQADVEKGMRDMQLKMIEAGDSIYVYLDAPFIFRKQTRSRNTMIKTEDINYEYNFDLTLKVPAKTNLLVSTVNDGNVTVENVTGDIKARNVNGGVKLSSVMGKTDVSTVNGNIDVSYLRNPASDSKFRTVNGNLTMLYAPDLNAIVAFKSMHGQFYTDLPEVEMMPAKVVRNTNNQGSQTIYQIDKNQSYKVGKRGVGLSFETLNGNIYLKKK